MNLHVIQDHLVTAEHFERWNSWEQGHLLALCGFDCNEKWVETQELGLHDTYDLWMKTHGLCPACLDHPDYALHVLGAV